MKLDAWHSLQRSLACFSVLLLFIYYLGLKDFIKDNGNSGSYEQSAPFKSGYYEKTRHDPFNVSGIQNRWSLHRGYDHPEEPDSREGVVYFYYVVKRVL